MRQRMGRSQLRLEDDRLLLGQGRYTGDVRVPGEAAMVFLRSSSAAGRILELDIADARKAPGVLAVLTADDLHAAGVGSFVPGARHNTPAGEL